MEYLRNLWNNISNSAIDLWYYFFGISKSEQLLLEYVIMEEDLSTRFVNTGENIINDSHNSVDKHKSLFESPNTNYKYVQLSNGTTYKFLFDYDEN